MWKPIVLRLNNFISHQDTCYTYSKGLELIQGINLDDEDGTEESNGSGKSSLLQAEYFVLTGNPVRDIRQSDLILEGFKDGYVEIELFNSITNNNLKIKRQLFSNKSAVLSIELNNIQQEFASVAEGDKRIIELLGLQIEDLTNYYLISKTKYNSFYSSSDNKKKEIIGRFAGSNLLTGIEALVELDIKEDKEKLNKLEIEESSANGKITAFEWQIEQDVNVDDEKNALIEAVQLRILNEEKKINTYNGNIKSNDYSLSLLQEKIKENNIQLKVYEDELKSITKVDNSVLIEEIYQYEKDVLLQQQELSKKRESFNYELRKSNNELNKTENSLSGAIECPKCKFEFSIKEKGTDIKELRLFVTQVKEEISKIKSNISELEQNYEKTNGDLQELIEAKAELKNEVDKINKLEREIKQKISTIQNEIDYSQNMIVKTNNDNLLINQNINMCYSNIESFKLEIEEIKQREIENKSLSIKKMINEIKSQLDTIVIKKTELEQSIMEKQQWVYNFISFKSYLANKAIKSIEGETNNQLERMGSNIQIQLEGFTLLADNKTIREKISCHVLKDGMMKGVLGKFSEGEKSRVEIATILALQKLLNLSCPNGGLDLTSIDEILESLSKKGLMNLIDSLKDLNQNIKLVTHVTLDKEYPDISRTVVKENGISNLK